MCDLANGASDYLEMPLHCLPGALVTYLCIDYYFTKHLVVLACRPQEGRDDDRAANMPERPLIGRDVEMTMILNQAANMISGIGAGGTIVIEGNTGALLAMVQLGSVYNFICFSKPPYLVHDHHYEYRDACQVSRC